MPGSLASSAKAEEFARGSEAFTGPIPGVKGMGVDGFVRDKRSAPLLHKKNLQRSEL